MGRTNKALQALSFICLIINLCGCDTFYTLDKHRPKIFSTSDFHQAQGHQLRYDLYMPNSYLGWHHTKQTIMSFDENTHSYWLKNIDNYNKAGKIYVPLLGKIFQTLLSIFDFIKLLFVKAVNYDNHINHSILEEEIKINERI